jgi:hypothetical protein
VGDELVGDMSGLKDLGLQYGGRVEVQIYLNLEFNVDGRGNGYQNKVEVYPDERMMDIMEKFSSYRLFAQRGFQVYSDQLKRYFSVEDMENTLVRDSGLVNNSKLILKQPPKQVQDEEEEEDMEANDYGDEGAEYGEEELIEMEEGEAEMEELAEEAEAEQVEDDGEQQAELDQDSADENAKEEDASGDNAVNDE